jgi:hypothetical protein
MVSSIGDRTELVLLRLEWLCKRRGNPVYHQAGSQEYRASDRHLFWSPRNGLLTALLCPGQWPRALTAPPKVPEITPQGFGAGFLITAYRIEIKSKHTKLMKFQSDAVGQRR